VPMGLLTKLEGNPLAASASVIDTQAAAARAREIVMEIERGLGFDPTDREFDKLGYDIESRVTWHRKVALHRSQRPRLQRDCYHCHT